MILTNETIRSIGRIVDYPLGSCISIKGNGNIQINEYILKSTNLIGIDIHNIPNKSSSYYIDIKTNAGILELKIIHSKLYFSINCMDEYIEKVI